MCFGRWHHQKEKEKGNEKEIVMGMQSIADFMVSLELPKQYFGEEFVIADKLAEEAQAFMTELKKCDGLEFPANQREAVASMIKRVLTTTESQFSLLETVLKCHEKSDAKAAQEAFYVMMKEIEPALLVSTVGGAVRFEIKGKASFRWPRDAYGYKFYRVRSAPNSAIEKDANEMFHIPSKKRQLASNERFSLCGFPSLYLSTMQQLAWQECGYPPEYYCSEFQYLLLDVQDDWKIIALCSPREIHHRFLATRYNADEFDLWLSIIERCLKMYPLVLACSFTNANGKAPFKQEYIIPQMLMQWVHRNNNKYNGISYFSCIDMRSERRIWNAYNLVIPALPPYDNDGLSLALKEHFNWSMPVYVQAPILASNTTTPDVQILDAYSNEICQAIGNQYVPTELTLFAEKLLSIVGDMRTVLTRSAGADMQLVLHMLDSINTNLSSIQGFDYDGFIAAQRKKLEGATTFFEDAFDQVAQRLKSIYKKICGYDSNSVNVEGMIRKYHWGIWGEFRQIPRLHCFCITEEDKRWIADWAKSHHILFYGNLSNEETIKIPRKYTKIGKIDMASFWPSRFAEMVADERWCEENLDKITSPVFVKSFGGEYTFVCAEKDLKKREDSLVAAFCKK